MTDQQSSKIALVTGATGAIGKAIATQLARYQYQVVLIARDPHKTAQVVDDIIAISENSSVTYKIADLSRKSAIQSLADEWDGPLQLLINNAAIAPQTRQTTPEDIELQFATNVLGYFWMITSFAEILKDSSPARVINVASYWAGGLDLSDLEFNRRPYNNHDAYRQSKQANRMLTPIFAELFKDAGVTVNSCHPGDVNSTLSNSLGFGGSQSPADGASTPVWLATSESLDGITGKYFENEKEVRCQFASRLEQAEELYQLCLAY